MSFLNFSVLICKDQGVIGFKLIQFSIFLTKIG